jgi:hypothetical protein
MHSFILQDWTTIRGGVTTVTQGEDGWLDLSPYQDVVFWIDVREATSTPLIQFQTSPTKDDSLFTPMLSAAQTLTAATTPLVKAALLASANVPVARFVRWQINGTVTWDATFRVLVAANSPGM